MEDINFFSINKNKYPPISNKKILLFFIIVFLNLTTFIYYNYKIKKTISYKMDLESLVDQNYQIQDIEKLNKKLNEYEELIYLKKENENLSNKNYIKKNTKYQMESLLKVVPVNTYLIDLVISQQQIIISGKSENKIDIYKFYKNLRSLDNIKNVNIDEISKKEDAQYFNISAKIR